MTYEAFWRPLTQVYEAGEAKAVAQLVFEVSYGWTMADMLSGREGETTTLRHLQERLLHGEPVQYVLGVAEFGGRRFTVGPGVLIPRPETYELCQWVMATSAGGTILDIGTGSGCIACTLAAEMPQAEVTAWDISETALDMARENAKRTGVHVSFEQVDVLNVRLTAHCSPLTSHLWDTIISNPPYICERERTSMERNVLDYEPPTALFVPDDDPLLFYRAIAAYGQQALKPGGRLYFELNPRYADDVSRLLSMMSYHDIRPRKDNYGKQRMISAQR